MLFDAPLFTLAKPLDDDGHFLRYPEMHEHLEAKLHACVKPTENALGDLFNDLHITSQAGREA